MITVTRGCDRSHKKKEFRSQKPNYRSQKPEGFM